MRGRLPIAFLLLPFLCGCVAYPRGYWRTIKGQARVEPGQPISIKAAVVKECEDDEGNVQEFPGRERVAKMDAQGHYTVSLHSLTWESRSFFSEKHCESRVQLYVCRDYCREVDQVDIDVLGK